MPFGPLCDSQVIEVPTAPGIYLIGPNGGIEHRYLQGSRSLSARGAVSPDGTEYAVYASDVGTPTGVILDLRNGNIVGRFAAINFTVAWSPDSQHFAYMYGPDQDPRRLRIADRFGNVERSYDTFIEIPYDMAWSPDGTQLAISTAGYDSRPSSPGVHLIDVASGATHRLTSEVLESIAWSADGASLVGERTSSPEFGVHGGGIFLVSTVTGAGRVLRETGGFPTWTRDGDIAATADGVDGLVLLHIAGGPERLVSPYRVWSWPESIGPDGHTSLAFVHGNESSNPGAYLIDLDGCARKLINSDGSVPFLFGAWRPAGQGLIIHAYPSCGQTAGAPPCG